MKDYLLLRLYGPLASWGEIAVGEARHSAVHPSRSALLGLLAAALGIRRDDELGQQAITQGYRFAVKLEQSGRPLRDYHTVQKGVLPRKGKFRTRRQELAADKCDTLLSSREYRCDSLALVAVESLAEAPYSLEQLAKALRFPVFTLYLGRKSCPLAIPLSPQQVKAESVREALDTTPWFSLLDLAYYAPKDKEPKPWPTKEEQYLFRLGQARYYWEDGMEAGMSPSFESIRQDQPLSRQRWQFAPRREWVCLSEGTPV